MVIRAITEDEFRSRTDGDRYWAQRWPYVRTALEMVFRQERFDRYLPRTALEIGPYNCPVVVGADTMDIHACTNPTWLWDVTKAPWPIQTDYYELVVALQVWEHLNGLQRPAFTELVRCCRSAVLSFPLLWDQPEDPIHHGITFELIRHWTLGIDPVRHAIVKGAGGRQRYVALWEF